MSKNLGNLKEQLGDLTEDTPSIHTKAGEGSRPEAPKAKAPVPERNAQYLLKMRRDQRRQLTRLAAMEDMTIRAFILSALRDKGLEVTVEDLVDLRRTAE